MGRGKGRGGGGGENSPKLIVKFTNVTRIPDYRMSDSHKSPLPCKLSGILTATP